MKKNTSLEVKTTFLQVKKPSLHEFWVSLQVKTTSLQVKSTSLHQFWVSLLVENTCLQEKDISLQVKSTPLHEFWVSLQVKTFPSMIYARNTLHQKANLEQKTNTIHQKKSGLTFVQTKLQNTLQFSHMVCIKAR